LSPTSLDGTDSPATDDDGSSETEETLKAPFKKPILPPITNNNPATMAKLEGKRKKAKWGFGFTFAFTYLYLYAVWQTSRRKLALIAPRPWRSSTSRRTAFRTAASSDIDAAIKQAEKLAADGADILDIGGESTRPGSKPVTADQELSSSPSYPSNNRIDRCSNYLDTTKSWSPANRSLPVPRS
jgi:hypothetical protein